MAESAHGPASSSGQAGEIALSSSRMREPGLPKVLTWRWAPCVALALGACSFAAFAMLVIPERIGTLEAGSSSAASFGADARFASTQSLSQSADDRSASASNNGPSSFSTLPSHQGVARAAVNLFPKRGFSPPLERPEPPAPPPAAVPPQPALDPAALQAPPPPAAPEAPAMAAPPPAPEPVAMPAPAEAAAPDTPSRQAD